MVLKSRLPAPDWSADGDPEREALCRKFPLPDDNDVSKDPWFYPPDMEDAASICNGTFSNVVCPFRMGCLHRALINNEGYGVFGGLLAIQRKWVRRNIPKDQWSDPRLWLLQVPSVADLEEEKSADAEEDAQD